ncbi:hypothetical protein BGY98DRAFT_936089 [Russula aff. rugulosa BPL654]|nr:hypothetical protein BGY98DRAFT_936089 [Russula aff. rugulosa BPL654]
MNVRGGNLGEVFARGATATGPLSVGARVRLLQTCAGIGAIIAVVFWNPTKGPGLLMYTIESHFASQTGDLYDWGDCVVEKLVNIAKFDLQRRIGRDPLAQLHSTTSMTLLAREKELLKTGKTGPHRFKVFSVARQRTHQHIRDEQLYLELQPVIIVSMPCRILTLPGLGRTYMNTVLKSGVALTHRALQTDQTQQVRGDGVICAQFAMPLEVCLLVLQ